MRERLLRLDTWGVAVLGVLVVVAVFDPSGGILPGVKYAALFALAVLASVVGLRTRLSGLRRFRARALLGYVTAFSVLLPAYGIAVHFIRGDYAGGHWSVYLGSNVFFAVLAVSLAVIGEANRFEKLLVASLTGLALVVWGLFFIGLVVPTISVYTVGHELQIYTFTHRSYAGVLLPYVYYYTSPLLVLPACYWMRRAVVRGASRLPVILLAVVLGALFLSGTRAGIASAVVVLAVFVWHRSRRVFVGLAGLAVVVAVVALTQLHVTSALGTNTTSRSNSIKGDYLTQYGHLFSHLDGLVFGYGLGSCVLSPIRSTCMTVTELTYLDLVRIFGLLGGLAYLALLVLPLWRLARISSYLALPFLLYLMVAALDPYIFSTNGMLPLTAVVLAAVRREADPGLWTFGWEQRWRFSRTTYGRAEPRRPTPAPRRLSLPGRRRSQVDDAVAGPGH